MTKPFIAAAQSNRHAIFSVLARTLVAARTVLEIGAGTGQHAVHFAAGLPHLEWCPTELPERLDGVRAWVDEAALPNLAPPQALDVTRQPWPVARADAVYASNAVHFMSWPAVVAMFAGIGDILGDDGRLILYGPFNYGGRFISEGNRQLDAWLRREDPAFGIRDFEALDALAQEHGFGLSEDCAMPANNRVLIWRRPAS